MKYLVFLVAVSFLISALSGCKSTKVSRTFDADMNTTWNAVIKVAEKVANKAPDVNITDRKIVTGWITGDVTTETGSDLVKKETVDMWRGIISLKSSGSKTTVTVKLQKGSVSSNPAPDIYNGKNPEVGYTFWSNEAEAQNKFLDNVDLELNNNKQN
ncbi:MAG: hypothetical protein ACYC27_19955 [Armatimonadota bacterium]